MPYRDNASQDRPWIAYQVRHGETLDLDEMEAMDLLEHEAREAMSEASVDAATWSDFLDAEFPAEWEGN